jgi:hypothetical protein
VGIEVPSGAVQATGGISFVEVELPAAKPGPAQNRTAAIRAMVLPFFRLG